jgi:chaperonin GroEL
MTPIKQITFNEETREKMLKGVEKIAKAVGSTLGPMGRNVVIETPYGATTVTKDGVTVAKHIELQDPFENLAVSILKQAASKTATSAGDGTTTSTVIAAALVKNAHKLISLGTQPIEIKRVFEDLRHKTLLYLTKHSTEVSKEDIQKIATISANNDEEIGSMIKTAYDYVGRQGLISLGESKTGATYLDLLPGIAIQRGYASPYFITNAAKGEVELENPLVFITDNKLRHTDEVIPILEYAASKRRPLLIIADAIDGQALQLLVINKIQQRINVAAIEAPSFGDNRAEILKDLSALTSAKIFSSSDASRATLDVSASNFGSVEKVTISKDKTVFISPTSDPAAVQERVSFIRNKMEQDSDNPYLLQQYQKRLADLTAKAAIINVGAPTETELKEIKDRVEDALKATSAAVSEGYLTGGGTALLWASEFLPSDTVIHQAFKDALKEPLKVIAYNAGKTPEVILEQTLNLNDPDKGFNAYRLEFTNLREAGVIDPTEVVSQAVKNAVSAANMIILSDTAMTNLDRTPPYTPPSPEYA